MCLISKINQWDLVRRLYIEEGGSDSPPNPNTRCSKKSTFGIQIAIMGEVDINAPQWRMKTQWPGYICPGYIDIMHTHQHTLDK